MRTSLFWYTKDLRLADLPGLAEAARSSDTVLPVYVWDKQYLEDEADNRKAFLLESIADLDSSLRKRASGLSVLQGDTVKELLKLCKAQNASHVYCSESRDPATSALQSHVSSAIAKQGITLHICAGNYLLSPDDIKTGARGVYRVFTPFRNTVLKQLPTPRLASVPKQLMRSASASDLPKLNATMLSPSRQRGGESEARKRWRSFLANGLRNYADSRNELANVEGVSRMSAFLNFGAISVREMLRDLATIDDPAMQAGKTAYLNELLWREFNYYIAHHFPHVLGRAFREELSFISWKGTDRQLEAWKEGRTGYPIVDAAMRELRETGWMHNRARMIVASFLVKDLLLDWQLGEAHFMEWLTDGDAVQNNSGWQWSASTGVDAQPYFRIFNPVTQGKRFDKDGEYVRRYVPELRHRPNKTIHDVNVADGYPKAIVDHKEQRDKAMAMFKQAIDNHRR